MSHFSIFRSCCSTTLSVLLATAALAAGSRLALASESETSNAATSGASLNHGAGGEFQVHGPDGSLLAQGALAAGNSITSVHSAGDGSTVATTALADPDQPIRLLLRLREEPVKPFMLRLQKRLAVDGTMSTSKQAAELKRAVDAHAIRLKAQQDNLLGELAGRGQIDQVHGRFVQLTNSVSVSAPGTRLAALRANPRVQSVHPDVRVTASLAASVAQIGAPSLWTQRDRLDRPVTGHGIRVAIIDTGIDYRHPDLGSCFGPGCKVVGGYDFVSNDADPVDDHGHGTHVAGIVAANGVLRGVAPDAQLLAYKVLDQSGGGYSSAIIAGLERAMDPDQNPLTTDRADVINMSLGGPGSFDSPLSEAANNAVAAGSVVIAAAGNSGPAVETIDSPGSAEKVITVAASDAGDAIASFSSRGPIAGRDYVKPELSAPGVAIESTVLGNGHARKSGTSMAAPHVAGAAALLLQRDPAQSPEAIKSQLLAGARPLQTDVFAQGAGRVDLPAASAATLQSTPALLGFGLVDVAQAQWQTQRTLRLHNTSATAQTLRPSVDGALPAGAQLAFEPAGEILLAAGESRELKVTLNVDNALLAYPANDSLHLESAVTVAGAGAPLRVPLVFHKADLLRLTVERAASSSYWVWLRGVDSDYRKWINASDTDSEHMLRVKPGTYDAMSLLWTGTTWSWVMQTDIVVTGQSTVELKADDAHHRVHIASVIDSQGEEIATRLITGGLVIHWGDRRSGEWLTTFLSNGDAMQLFRLSAMSDRFSIKAGIALTDSSATDYDQVRYLLSATVSDGVDRPIGLQLDARTSGHAKLEFDHPQRRQLGPLAIQLAHRDFIAIPNGVVNTQSVSNIIPRAYSGALRASIYASTPELDIDASFAELLVTHVQNAGTPDAIGQPVASSGVLGFPSPGRYARLDSVDAADHRGVASVVSTDPFLDIHHGGAYFASRVMFVGNGFALINDNLQLDFARTPLLKDLQQSEFAVQLPYELSCAGSAERDVGEIAAWQSISIPARCQSQPLELRLSMTVDVLGNAAASLVEHRFSAGPGFWHTAPQLTRLELLSDGEVSRLLDGDELQVRMHWGQGDQFDPSLQVRLEYQLDDQPGWRPLTIERDGAMHVARLPLLSDGPHLASLRIFAENANGSSQQQTLHSLFVLGKNRPLQSFRDRHARRLGCVSGC